MDCIFTTFIACLAFFAGVEFSGFINGPNGVDESAKCVFVDSVDVTEEDTVDDLSNKKRKRSKNLKIKILISMDEESRLHDPRIVLYRAVNDIHGNTYYGGNHYYGTEGTHHEEQAVSETDKIIVKELLGMFYGQEEEALDFLLKVKGMKDTDICLYVKKLVAECKISELSYKSDLWKILNNHDIYKAGYRNWAGQVSL